MESCLYLLRGNCIIISSFPFVHTTCFILSIHYEVDSKPGGVSRIFKSFWKAFLEIPKLLVRIQTFPVQKAAKQTICKDCVLKDRQYPKQKNSFGGTKDYFFLFLFSLKQVQRSSWLVQISSDPISQDSCGAHQSVLALLLHQY